MCHAGFLYGLRDPAPLLDALLICRDKLNGTGRRIRFVQIGRVQVDYDLKGKYADLIDDSSLELVDEIPYRECLNKLSQSDVLVNIQPGTKTQVPSKLYDYLALNRPILTITPHDGALGQMALKYRFGDVYEPHDIEGLATRLLELSQIKLEQGLLRADYPAKSSFDIQTITLRFSEYLHQAINAC